jgi:1,4-alpha-glucan branching enzyme
MTSNYYNEYDIGALHEGTYQEVFNSDRDIYGGWNQYNGLDIATQSKTGPEYRPYTLTIKLASYGALILKKLP